MPRVPQPEPLEQHADPLAPFRHVIEAPVQLEVLEGGQLPVDQRLVREEADPLARDVDTELTLARQCETRDDAQECRLAGAVGAGDDGEAPSRELEVDAAQDALVAEAATDAARRDHATASAITNAANATLITPFIVKNAASRRRRFPGRTSACS